MGKKGKKFDLTKLVNRGDLQDGQTLYFVSDPSKTCRVARQPNNEYKVTVQGAKEETTMTVHQFAQQCLGTEPPDHASKWLRTDEGATLYDLWHKDDALPDVA